MIQITTYRSKYVQIPKQIICGFPSINLTTQLFCLNDNLHAKNITKTNSIFESNSLSIGMTV